MFLADDLKSFEGCLGIHSVTIRERSLHLYPRNIRIPCEYILPDYVRQTALVMSGSREHLAIESFKQFYVSSFTHSDDVAPILHLQKWNFRVVSAQIEFGVAKCHAAELVGIYTRIGEICQHILYAIDMV